MNLPITEMLSDSAAAADARTARPSAGLSSSPMYDPHENPARRLRIRERYGALKRPLGPLLFRTRAENLILRSPPTQASRRMGHNDDILRDALRRSSG